ncbi:hypothetical protein P3T37_000653 [Kitasatospora sp. MAA4]|uniref:cupin domain-containing protein n=1 Tax=Kitasatospora sp. MAA4 TaxID=3035093 RepID=UPI0024737772|nr:cupin domain-containing protein [Kitasatospora sp. MAA4]MDH6131284.1 hypothetical protein [Kitasatospora sp. MAA4]
MEALLSDVFGTDFLVRSHGKEHRLFRGEPERFAGYFDWGVLQDILSSHTLRSPQLRLVQQKKPLPEHAYLRSAPPRRDRSRTHIDPDRFTSALRDGHTLALRYVDELHPPLRTLACGYEQVLGADFEFNLYASWRPVQGFGVHRDDHDVFVHQLAGEKRWQIFAPTPEPLGYAEELGMTADALTPVDDLVLTAGDLLYLPRGFWHAPQTAGSAPSLHLTGSVASVRGADLVDWVARELRESPGMQGELPRFADASEQAAYLARLRAQVLARWDDPQLLSRFLAQREARYPASAPLTLDWSLDDH